MGQRCLCPFGATLSATVTDPPEQLKRPAAGEKQLKEAQLKTVLTLASAERGQLSEDLVRGATLELERARAVAGEPRWLVPGTACDLPFGGILPRRAEDLVRGLLAGTAVDLAGQPTLGRRKRLLVADMESTVIANEMLDELGAFAGHRRQIESITARAMRGELDFAGALRRRVALLEGLGVEVLERSLESVEVDPGAPILIATMAAAGAFSALVSGGFGCFVDPVARRLGFDAWRANEIEIAGGCLTGRVVEPIHGRDAKVRALEEYCRRLKVTAADAVAVGDGANDLGMLRAAGFGVAYHAKPAVAAAARYRIDHGDLSTLLYFQGYDEAEISSSDRSAID